VETVSAMCPAYQTTMGELALALFLHDRLSGNTGSGSPQLAGVKYSIQNMWVYSYRYSVCTRSGMGNEIMACTVPAHVGIQYDIRDERHRTEPDIGISDARLNGAEFNSMSDIGLNLVPISDIQYLNPTNICTELKAVGFRMSVCPCPCPCLVSIFVSMSMSMSISKSMSI
jgi:hypothetical protein